MFSNYLNDIVKTTQAGNVREESYYPDLKKLFEEYALINKKQINVTVLPKKTEASNPDFRIQTDKYQLIGYIEAKVPTIENLDTVESTEQLKRYLSTFPNLILTNFLEFRLYRNGELIDKVLLGRPLILNQLGVAPPVENELYLEKLFSEFFSFNTPRITTAKTLAIELAKRTQFLQENCIVEEQKEETSKGTQTLEGIYKLLKDYLISSLTLEEFSNLFSQTITFGLFAARLRSTSDFTRMNAFKTIPPTIGILRSIFRFISSNDLPKNMEWVIDDIAELLSNTDVAKIVDKYYENGKGSDPIIHFYETFLAEYDPKERAKKGVYYTPEPVVSYIVKSVHKILQKKFKRPDGLASNTVTLLDPASGTLTFPVEAIKVAIEEYKNRYGDGGVNSLIKNHIIPHFFAFELMMSPYVLGHIKASLILNEYGYHLGAHERFNLYLTNTLDLNTMPYMELPLFSDLSEESRQANDVKKNKKIMVVMGNPPYSVSSSNKIKEGSEFYKLYESYKEKVRTEEKNIQPLSDDYIKFIAFAHWKIKQAGQGIVAMITNNSYLDGLIHRDLRRKLLDDFNEIYILNLHGNSVRKEKDENGNTDENIFDIKQGVSIALLIKSDNKSVQKIYYFDLIGFRDNKYGYLLNNDLFSTKWLSLNYSEFDDKFINTRWGKKYKNGLHFFTPKISKDIVEYANFFGLEEIFIKNSCGIKTSNDDKIVKFSKNELISSIVANNISLDTNKIKDYAYRPYDTRKIYWEDGVIDRTRKPLSDSIVDSNYSICVSKNTTISDDYSSVLISDTLTDLKYCEYSRGSYFFPLYNKKHEELTNDLRQQSNINLAQLPRPIQSQPSEAIFYYIYAVLHSNIYREKYKEFLKIDFPRIPFTENVEVFKSLVSLGEELVNLHLLKSPQLENPTTRFCGQGEGQVIKRKYDPENKRIHINDLQYFDNIEPEIWNYYIGGYQVLDKWLKDRVGRILSDEDVRHYCKVATTLKLTKEIQERIDRLYKEIEKEVS